MSGIRKKINSSINNIKHYDSRKVGANVRFIIKYLRILSLFLLPFIPIVISHILLFCDNNISSDQKSIALESVAYVQTLLFSVISYGIFFVCQIVCRLEQQLDLKHRKNQSKFVIDTGIAIILTAVFLSLIVFAVTSIIFVELKSKSNDLQLKQSVYHYTFIMIPYLLFLIIGHYFFYISLVSGFNWIKIFASLFISFIVEIILIYVFLFHIPNLDPLLAISIPSLIIAFLRCIVFVLVYLFKISYFDKKNLFKFCFNKNIYFGLIKATLLSSIFMFSFMFANIIQTIFIILSKKLGQYNFDYLFTKNNISLLLLTKIIVYNFFYLFFASSKSLGLTVVEHEDVDKFTFKQKIKRHKKLINISIYINMVNILLCLTILFCSRQIVNALFSSFDWANNIINNLPSTIHNTNYILELIIKMTQSGLLVGTFSYAFMEHTINYRYILFKFFKRNYKMFFTIILGYIFSFTVLTYLFVFQTHDVFYGLTGYLFPMVIYGIFCLITTYIFNCLRQYKLYSKNIPSFLNNINQFKFILIKPFIDYKIIKAIDLEIK